MDSNLARLLQFQFLCATSCFQRYPKAARTLLEYVCLMTEGQKEMVDFHYQASTLLIRLCQYSLIDMYKVLLLHY